MTVVSDTPRSAQGGVPANVKGAAGGRLLFGKFRTKGVAKAAMVTAALMLAGMLAGCGEQYQKGYILADGALDQIPIGASQDQVLIVLGTPSTVATLNGEVFYYISQRSERAIAFMDPKVTDRRVIAVYFDKSRHVERLANYGLRDGKIFDFISRTTPTGGQEMSYLSPIFRAFGVGN